jgi:hypothetical protein
MTAQAANRQELRCMTLIHRQKLQLDYHTITQCRGPHAGTFHTAILSVMTQSKGCLYCHTQLE